MATSPTYGSVVRDGVEVSEDVDMRIAIAHPMYPRTCENPGCDQVLHEGDMHWVRVDSEGLNVVCCSYDCLDAEAEARGR